MTNFIKSLLYISACYLLVTSCKNDPITVTESEKAKSYGSWMLAEATKDGKSTRTLEGAQFGIDSTSMKTNLFGEEQTFGYKRTGNLLKLNGGQDQVFTIDRSTADTLILGMKRRDIDYQLVLLKADSTLMK